MCTMCTIVQVKGLRIIFIFVLLYRCEDYAISLLEQCEDLREVETFLQTRNSGNKVKADNVFGFEAQLVHFEIK